MTNEIFKPEKFVSSPTLQEVTAGEVAKYFIEHPEDQAEILGGVFTEKELAGKMTAEVIMKGIRKMGLRPATVEELDAVLKGPAPQYLVWDAEEGKMRPYDPAKDDNWPSQNRRLFVRD